MYQEEKGIRDLLRRWLSGDSRRGDERKLDRHAQDDPFLADALEGYRRHAGGDHARRLEELRARLHQRTRRRSSTFPLWPRAAAAALLLAIAGGIWWWGGRSNAGRPAESMVMSEETATDAVPAKPDAIAFTDTLAGESGEPPLAAADPPPVREQPRQRRQPAAKPSPAPEAGIALAEKSAAAPPPPAAARTLRMPPPAAAAPPEQPGRDIRGRVSSETGSPLPGVVVAVPEKNIRTLTDEQGQYRLQIDSNVNRLTFEAPGFDHETKLIGDADTLDVALAFSPAPEAADEETAPKAKTAATPTAAKATPRGGFDKLERYLRRNLRYPAEARAQGIEGTVRVQFTVQSNGVPADFRIIGSPGYGCGEEAIRLLREGPRWKLPAGSQENTRTYDVVFKLN